MASTLTNQSPSYSDLRAVPSVDQLPSPAIQPAGQEYYPPANSQTGNLDQPTPVPVARPQFSLTNSSIVVAVPSHTPQSDYPVTAATSQPAGSQEAPPIESPPQAHGHHHKTEGGWHGKLPIIIAIAMPIALVFIGAALVAYRIVIQRRRRARHRTRESSHSCQLIISPSYDPSDHGHHHHLPHTMVNVHEKERLSSASFKSPYSIDDHLTNFGVRRGSRPCPALPPLPSPLPNSPPHTLPIPPPPLSPNHCCDSNYPPDSSPRENSPNGGGINCRVNCVVTQTFTPTMMDELKIGIGDRVTVYILFDDGWCLGENLDYGKHEATEGGSGSTRTGVLPQECLSGLKRGTMSDTTEEGSISWRTAAEEDPYFLPACTSRPSSQEILAGPSPTHSLLNPASFSKNDDLPLNPQRRQSSLLCDRETQLLRELDQALAFIK